MPAAELDLKLVRALSVDLDDTLWPIWPTIERAERMLQEWLAGRAPKAAAWFADTDMVRAARSRIALDQPGLGHDLSAVRRALIHQALLQAGEDVELADAAFHIFFDARHEVTLYEDALEFLAFFAARMPVVALSNGNADVHRIGIGEHFHARVSAQAFGHAKPDVRIFHGAAAAAGVPAQNVLHVGDDAVMDVRGARAAGMQAVWLQRGDAPWPLADCTPHATVRDLRELVARWDARPG